MSEPTLPFWKRAPLLTGYAVAIVSGGVAELALGSDPEVVALVVSASLVSIFPAVVFGVRDMPSLIALSVGARYASSAIAWRLMTGQRVDLGLYDPQTSFYVILCGTSAIAAAALAAHLLYWRKPLFREHYTSAGLEILIAAGAIATLFGFVAARSGANVLGGIESLSGTGTALLPVGLLCYNYARGRPALSPMVLIPIVALSILGLGVNSRQGVLQPFSALIFFILCFHVRVSRRALIAGILGGALFVAIISPVMLAVRTARHFASPDQMIALTISAMDSGQYRATAEAMDEARSLESGSYALHYTTGGGELAMRMVNVEQMDVLVDRAHRFGPIGTSRFWESFWELLPSAIASDKSAIKTPSYALWVYGLSVWGLESNATETAFGDAYAYGGVPFVLSSMFSVFLLLFVIFRIFCPRFEYSPLALFFVAAYIHALTEQNVIGTLAIPIRAFPFELVLFWLASQTRQRFFALA